MDNNDIILEGNGSVGLHTHRHLLYVILLYSSSEAPSLLSIVFWELFAKSKVARV
jgi:hypothetical protein